MTNPHPVEHVVSPSEWPPAAQTAFAAALHFLLPKDKPVLELRARASAAPGAAEDSIIDPPQQPGPSAPVARLMKTYGVPLTALDLPGRPVRRSSASKLRRPADSLGGVYTISFLDLDWKALVPEIVRALAPDGLFAVGTGDEVPTDINNHMEVGWEMTLQRNEITLVPEASPRSSLEDAVVGYTAEAEQPVSAEVIPVCRWSDQFTPRAQLEAASRRRGPKNHHISDMAFGRCLKDYERWLKAQYSNLDAPLDLVRECAVHVWRFGA